MNRDIAIPDEERWVVDRYVPGARPAGAQDQRSYSPSNFLDFATLMKIVSQWRWLIIGAVGLGLAAAIIITLLTTPLYRSFVTLEVNPPSVEIMDEKKVSDMSATTPWDFVATQAGLLESKNLATRVAQDLNLANNKEFVGTDGDSQSRLQAASAKVTSGLQVEVPEEGQLIKFSYSS